jgi:hypothetical protein
LSAICGAALALADAKSEIDGKASDPRGVALNSPAEFAAVIQSEGPKWTKVIKDAAIEPLD